MFPPIRFLIIIVSLVISAAMLYRPSTIPFAKADEISDLQAQINDLNSKLSQSRAATKPLEGQLSTLQAQLASIQAKLNTLSASIAQKEIDIKVREDKLADLMSIFNERVVKDYKDGYQFNILAIIFGSEGKLSDKLYHLRTIDENRSVINSISTEVTNILAEKDRLEKDKASLASLQAQVDKNAQFLGGEIGKAKTYQASLSSQIAQLSAQQQSLIAAKLASLNIPRSASTAAPACVDDRGVDPGFSPRLAFFTYGVPNRVGLNQYGAWGRAKANQSAEDILSAYYPGLTLKKDYDKGATINVNGYGPYNVEEYVKRIYEMPASWTDNGSAALKAQAVAARSYGLAHRGGICTTDSCQVFKPDPKTDNNNAWINAVKDTAGWVLADGSGNPASTQYSSTHGGYILNLNKFDGVGGTPASFADLASRAYDKNSPWFYCDWGARAAYAKTAWLKESEVADIVNVILLAKADSSTKDHLYQTDKPHPYGGEVWNEDRVKSELRSKSITPFNNVSGVSVSPDFSSGKLNSVTVSGDAGSQSLNASEFKDWFNLRAPANIQIVGPLFNVEKK